MRFIDLRVDGVMIEYKQFILRIPSPYNSCSNVYYKIPVESTINPVDDDDNDSSDNQHY